MKILAVTACPTGVVNTYMAAEALKKACKKFGLKIKVETQGSIGIENKITKNDTLDADAVILTKDIPIKNKERFKDLPIIKVSVSDAIKKAESIIKKIKK
ncbi:MAG: PTS fructose-like transporter subunit IIB [Firmicutes bacterium]|nr:PTS fructose-like transporter subunit IIB [Bacillota bacterium]